MIVILLLIPSGKDHDQDQEHEQESAERGLHFEAATPKICVR
jgi:hypothetical protein